MNKVYITEIESDLNYFHVKPFNIDKLSDWTHYVNDFRELNVGDFIMFNSDFYIITKIVFP